MTILHIKLCISPMGICKEESESFAIMSVSLLKALGKLFNLHQPTSFELLVTKMKKVMNLSWSCCKAANHGSAYLVCEKITNADLMCLIRNWS